MLRSISRVNTLPSVSRPRLRGVTSSSSTSCTSPASTPPCMAAPRATASSGLTALLGSLPKNALTAFRIAGMRVDPPTMIISLISLTDNPASFKASRHGVMARLTRSSVRLSNFALVIFTNKCFGPDASAVIYGMFTSVSVVELSSILAFSADSRKRCSASLSLRTSIPLLFLNSSAI